MDNQFKYNDHYKHFQQQINCKKKEDSNVILDEMKSNIRQSPINSPIHKKKWKSPFAEIAKKTLKFQDFSQEMKVE